VPSGRRSPSVAVGLALVVAMAAAVAVLLNAGAPLGEPNPSAAHETGLLYCNYREFPFSRSALMGEARAELEPSDSAAALRGFLRVESMPATNWRMLAQNSEAVLFGNGRDGAGTLSYVVVERNENWGPGYTLPRQGPWGVGRWGGCELRPYNPRLDTAEWILGVGGLENDRRFTALVAIGGCFGGQPTPRSDIHPPEIDYQVQTVTVSFFAEFKPPGAYSCPGSPRTAYEVTLREPLNGRELLDGGWYPPKLPSYTPGRAP